MKHSTLEKRNPYAMLSSALLEGWETIDSIPVAGDGEFVVLTISGLIRTARNRNAVRKHRRADSYGPKRTTVVAVDSGNYLGAIAWKPA